MIFVLPGTHLAGQIDISEYEKNFGKGEIALKKKINISFFYNEEEETYMAKVTHRYDKLYIDGKYAKGLVQIPFNTFQELTLQKARYFRFGEEDKKILIENVKVKYADEKNYFIKNIFYGDLKVKQFNCSVNLPEDYFLSYSYEVVYKDLKFLTSFFFQNAGESVESAEISIEKNVNIDFSVFEFNLEGVEKTEDDHRIKFKTSNLKRYRSNEYSVNGSYYLPHIIVSVNQVNINGQRKDILKSTDHLYAWYYSLIKELSPDDEYIQKLASSITENCTTDEQQIKAVFQWVQNNVQYVAFEDGLAGFKPTEADRVALLKYGDCKGMANLLVSLLQARGFDARHAWIGTRSKNYSYTLPSLVVDNHMICGLNYKGEMYFLDGTGKAADWRIPPPHLEGKEVMVANNESYEILSIAKSTPEENEIIMTGFIDLGKPRPEIELTVAISGHFMRDFMGYETYSSLRSKSMIPYYFINRYLDGINVGKVSLPEFSDDGISFTVSGHYLNLAKGEQTIVFPFLDLMEYGKLREKEPPLYIDYPQTIDCTLEVKNGGKTPMESYPKGKTGTEEFSASFYTESTNGKVLVHQNIQLNLLHTPVAESKEWNAFYTELNAFNNYPLTYD